MTTPSDRVAGVSGLSPAEMEHLRALCSSWQVLADLSFSDLLLYVPVSGAELFEVAAQQRPLTSQTRYAEDMVGVRATQPEQPVVERAFREGRIWSQDEPLLVNGVPIRMDAVPVRFRARVIAVVTKEGNPWIARRPGRLEEVYIEAAEHVSRMICDGSFPFAFAPSQEWPRVGEGLLVLDESARLVWASPNALSSLHRLGVTGNVVGCFLDELDIGSTQAREALSSRTVVDGELVQADAHVSLRLMPLLNEGRAIGALGLARDVSELRRKERVISVKDAAIREVHHRVKNNLQTIASLLRLQGRRAGSEEARAALEESVLRIGSIALVHETLSEQGSDVTDFGEVARRIVRMVADGLVPPGAPIELKVTGGAGTLGARVATPLAVTLTELLQNAVQHAFPDGRGGTIAVELARERGDVQVTVWDDGVGLGDAPAHEDRLGLQIVRLLVGELGGRFRLMSESGTRAELHIPV